MGPIEPDAQTQRLEVLQETMLTTTRNGRIDHYSPTNNPQLARKIYTECQYVGAVDQRISRYDWVKPAGTARERRGNARAKCGPSSAGIDQKKDV
ncbi:unnamed protein product [Echinostoma caproni]|uniref:DNA-directed RNA polymerase n=1 Tax=Echinostoma caproni TaxID=27848 RepID=A0A183B8K6_9TREM|nr:unnamed protein product [Echinostoma caproni]